MRRPSPWRRPESGVPSRVRVHVSSFKTRPSHSLAREGASKHDCPRGDSSVQGGDDGSVVLAGNGATEKGVALVIIGQVAAERRTTLTFLFARLLCILAHAKPLLEAARHNQPSSMRTPRQLDGIAVDLFAAVHAEDETPRQA